MGIFIAARGWGYRHILCAVPCSPLPRVPSGPPKNTYPTSCMQVEVFSPATQQSYFFACNDWLRKTKEHRDKSLRKELLAGETSGLCIQGDIAYALTWPVGLAGCSMLSCKPSTSRRRVHARKRSGEVQTLQRERSMAVGAPLSSLPMQALQGLPCATTRSRCRPAQCAAQAQTRMSPSRCLAPRATQARAHWTTAATTLKRARQTRFSSRYVHGACRDVQER